MRKEKTFLLDEITDKFENSNSWIITSYENINPKSSWDLRNMLSKSESEYEVVKKRIFIRAAKKAGIKLDLDLLKGHIGVVFVYGDPMGATKAVYKAKDHMNLSVLNAQIEGKSYDAAEMELLSKLPSKDEMRAQFLSVLEAPMSETVSVMNSLLTSVVYAIEEKKKLEEKK
ncbi:MAG: 50S ribosomal protein L10 [Candidatus Anoxychlamydiales bacterium]|nr:50S ribosomal protein L10 [Candidatus Anoxychlamydiales bacterium]